MKNLIALANSTEFKPFENIFIYNVSAAMCLYLGKKVIVVLVYACAATLQAKHKLVDGMKTLIVSSVVLC